MGHKGWTGVFPAALSMFSADGSLDDEATAIHLDELIASGADGIVIAGSSGEWISMNEEERRRIIKVGVAAVAGRVPLIAGTGYFSTAATIELTEYAASAGADGVIITLPYYQRPTEDEVFRHFQTVGSASPLPVMVYNNPATTSAPPLTPARIRELYSAGQIQAIKCTYPTAHYINEIVNELDDGFRVFYGGFVAPLEGIAGGAHGWISGIHNVALSEALRLWDAMQASDLVGARKAWGQIQPIKYLHSRQILGPSNDLAIYRAILRLRGRTAGFCRPPTLELSDEQVGRLRAYLESDAQVLAQVGADYQTRRA